MDLPPGEAPATLDALLARFFAPESLERRCARDGCEGVCATLAAPLIDGWDEYGTTTVRFAYFGATRRARTSRRARRNRRGGSSYPRRRR